MGNMIDLICLVLYFYLLKISCFEGNLATFFVVCTITLYFIIKYKRVKDSELNLKKRLDTQWENFIELLNHDLKIPTIAQLRGLELLENNNTKNISKEEIISHIKQSCKYTLDMISMIVEAYNFENNSSKLVYERFNMTELLTHCFEDLSISAMEKNITFAYNLKSNDTYLEADKSEIKKVMINLLSNSINYTGRGNEVNVTISDKGNEMQISLSSKEFANNLINGSKYSTIGQSIGMYLCKKIIEIHRGKLYITENEKKDKIVSFSLPKIANSIYN